jgi:FkbM family methyltransferase
MKGQTPFEICVYAPEDDPLVSETILSAGLWESVKMLDFAVCWRHMQQFSKRDIVFVDVGANVGVFALLAAASGLKRVIAFEPVHANLGLMMASLQRNPSFNQSITIIAAGAGERDERLDMFVRFFVLTQSRTFSSIVRFVDLQNRGGSSFVKEKLKFEKVPLVRQQVFSILSWWCSITFVSLLAR